LLLNNQQKKFHNFLTSVYELSAQNKTFIFYTLDIFI